MRLIEARRGVIEVRWVWERPKGRAARVCGPLGRSGLWRLGARVLAGLTSPHGKKNASCGDRGQRADEDVGVCAGLR